MRCLSAKCAQCASTILGMRQDPNYQYICSQECEERYDARLALQEWYPTRGYDMGHSMERTTRLVRWCQNIGSKRIWLWVIYCTGFQVYE